VDDSAVPEALRRLNFIFFDDPARFDASADTLAAALQTDIGWIRQHTEYGEAERRWSAAGYPTGLLLHSPTLEVAEHWIVSRPSGAPEPTQEIQAFIVASRDGLRAGQRFRRLVQAFIFTLLASIILGLVGWINQDYIKAQWRWYATERPFLAANIWPFVLKPAVERGLKPKDTFRECAPEQGEDYCPEMIVVPAGSFMMGSPPTETYSRDTDIGGDERPLHTVTIAQPFAVARYELTFAEWDTCAARGDCTWRPSDGGWGRGQQPVIYVSWDDARQYVAWLAKVTGKPYRLLSESEYEYATRAGTKTAYPWGDDIGKNNANCIGCGSKWDNRQPAPVGSFAPNRFGLYDMVGNVYSWVEDCLHIDFNGAPADGLPWIQGSNCTSRVGRGGSWNADRNNVRSGSRDWGSTVYRQTFWGFRVARTLIAP
jgi:formylglycine-generating enzyme required for sulfatase activity